MPDTADSDLKGRAARKSATAYRTISEVSEELDVPQHVLRFWETKFSQVRPMKRGGGRRYYRPEDVLLLRRIQKLLYQDGYTIKGVQRLLREGRTEPGSAEAGPHEPAEPHEQPHEPGEEAEAREPAEPPEEEGRESRDIHAEAPFVPAPAPTPAEEAAPAEPGPAVPEQALAEPPPAQAEAAAAEPTAPAARLSPELRGELTALLEELRRLRAVLRGG